MISLGVGVLLAGLTAGVIYIVLLALRPVPPEVTVSAVNVHGVTRDGLVLRIALKIKNPNRVGIELRGFNARVTVEGQSLGEPRITSPTARVGARAERTVTVELVAPWGRALAVLARSLETPTLSFAVDGDVRIGAGRLSIDHPVHARGTFASRRVHEAIPNSLPFGLGRIIPGMLQRVVPAP